MEKLSTDFYDNNYHKFSQTRFCLWDVVKKFAINFKETSLVLDAGCGNGKNIYHLKHICDIKGIDKCENLVNICRERGYNVVKAEINNLPFNENRFNFVICIAVLHHLEKEEKRTEAIKEMIRVLKPGGKLLITCWAYESDEYSKKKNFDIGDNYVKFNNKDIVRYYYIYDKQSFRNLCLRAHNNVEITWDRGNWNAIFTK